MQIWTLKNCDAFLHHSVRKECRMYKVTNLGLWLTPGLFIAVTWLAWLPAELLIRAFVKMTVPIVIETREKIWKTRDTMFWKMESQNREQFCILTNRYLRSGRCRPIEVHFRPNIENRNAAVWQAKAVRISILIAWKFTQKGKIGPFSEFTARG